MIIDKTYDIYSRLRISISFASASQLLRELHNTNPEVYEFEFTGCQIGSQIMDWLTEHSSCMSMILNVPLLCATALDSLVKNHRLTHLKIYHALVGDKGAGLIATMPLISLHLMYCNIHSTGALDLAKTTTIKHLNLHSNKIGYNGALALKANQTIKTLNLRNNDLDSSALAFLKKPLNLLSEQLRTIDSNIELIPSLKNLCTANIHRHFNNNTLKRKFNSLPESLIEDLQERKVLCLEKS